MKPTASILAVALSLAACAPTRQQRIAADPAAFNALPATQQVLVEQGRLALGMSKEAVRLALGEPATVMAGQGRSGREIELWVFQGRRQVYVHPTGLGLGYDYYFRHGTWAAARGGVAHVPYVRTTVEFTDGEVSSWTDTRDNP